MAPRPYRLRSELYFHTSDVRGVCISPSSLRAVTASRDCAIAIWNVDPSQRPLPSTPIMNLQGHDHFVNSVVFVDDITLVSASGDKTLRVWTLNPSAKSSCVSILQGHTDSVCNVSLIGGKRQVISSSWDMTARIWDVDSGRCLAVLTGHSAAVWAAQMLADGRIVTVAADKSVRIWTWNENISPNSHIPNVFLPSAHTDVIRSVALLSENRFVTVSNDSSLVLWAPHGNSFAAVSKISDLHDGSFSYSVEGANVDSDPNIWQLVSGGEDNALRIAQYDVLTDSVKPVQTIMHPSTVWSVAIGSSGDVLTGCSDGIARVFTRDPDAVASADVLASFEKAVSERQLNTKVIGGVDVSKLQSAEDALAIPGSRDGENKIVRNSAGAAEVHMWSESDGRWSKVGDVVDKPGGAAGSLGRSEVNGKVYDYVFDVDLGRGGQTLKLGYNRGENSYLAAQRFIDENEIDQDFLDQIAKFIDDQIPADALSTQQVASDPFTGSSRYIPGSSASSTSALNQIVPHVSSSATSPLPTKKLLPCNAGWVTYRTSDQIDTILSKLNDFNREQLSFDSPLALNASEMCGVGELLESMRSPSAGSSNGIPDGVCDAVGKLVKWHTSIAPPALDVARLALTRSACATQLFGGSSSQVLDDLLAHVQSPDAPAPVLILGCRFLCNMFENEVTRGVVVSRCENVLSAADAASASKARKARETYASLLLNYAIALQSSEASAAARAIPVRFCGKIALSNEKDEEVLYRILLALGTLMCGGPAYRSLGRENSALEAASAAAPVSARLHQLASEISQL